MNIIISLKREVILIDYLFVLLLGEFMVVENFMEFVV